MITWRKTIHAATAAVLLPLVAWAGLTTQNVRNLSAVVVSDTTPSAFSFTDQTNVTTSSTVTSAAVTISGINTGITCNATGGTIDKNGAGTFASSQSVVNNDTVRARHTASGTASTTVNTTVDCNGVSDVFSSTTAAGGGGSGNDGFIVTNGSTYNATTAQIQSIDINSNLPVALSSGASVNYATESWWNGTTTVGTFTPPTGNDAYAGFSNISFWNNATNVVRQVNVRWEFKLSDADLLNSAALPKWLIIDTYRELSTGETVLKDRPMLYLAHMTEADNAGNRIDNALTAVPAQGTVRCFLSSNVTPAPTADSGNCTGYQNQRQQWQVRATAGTDGSGNPIVDNDEYMVVEMRVNVMGTTDEPNGVIAMRIYRQNGTVFERATAWTNTPNDQGERPLINTNYIARIDVGGGGYYNLGSTGQAVKIGRRLTLATNYQPTTGRAWLGPPEGFAP